MKFFPRLFLLFLLPILCTVCGAAQQATCTLQPEQLPEVRGFKLGMTIDQIKQRYPHFKPPTPDAYGFSDFRYDFILERGRDESSGSDAKEPLAGIDRKDLAEISLAFLDNRLVLLKVAYSYPEWRDVDEFLRVVIESLKLPDIDQWSKKVDNRTMRLSCDKFIIQANIPSSVGGGSILFLQHGFSQEIEKRKQDKMGKEKQTFKP